MRSCSQGWRCGVCRVSSSSWNAIARGRCSCTAAAKWALAAAADKGCNGVSKPHTRWLSDDTIWCSRCGQYSSEAVVGLTQSRHPIRAGTRSNRRLLASGIHPWTRKPFRNAAVRELSWQQPEDISQCALVAPDLRHHVMPRGNVSASKRMAAVAGRARVGGCASELLRPAFPPTVATPTKSYSTPRMEAVQERVRQRAATGNVPVVPASKRRRLAGKQPPPTEWR